MTRLTKSYVHGAGTSPLLGRTVGEFLDSAVARYPHGEALVVSHQDIRWSWARLDQEVNRFAAGLLELGIEPGDRLGILSPNNAEWVVTQFASAKVGAILVNINPAYRSAELAYALDKTQCKVLVVAPRFKTSDYIQMICDLMPEFQHGHEHAHNSELSSVRDIVVLSEEPIAGMLRYSDVLRSGGKNFEARLKDLSDRLQFDDPINIQFTSGTTGTPKAATLSHHNIVNNAVLTASAMKLKDTDRLCIPVPMYHCFGMVLGTLCCVANGSTMVLPSEGFDAGAVLTAVAQERCTALHGVPTMFIAELEHPDFPYTDLSSLRTGIIAGAPCTEELMKRLVSEMHLREITIAYGMTETGPVSFQTSVDDPLERRVTTVGRVLPHTEVKLVDEAGRIVPVGEAGELLTRGYCVMSGYWEDADKTEEAIDAAGWIRSGDIAVLDEEGYCRIVGRIKDMLIRGGENIFPREIEEFLFTHPKVEDVQVVGVPDPKYGEEICACVKLRPGEQATEEELREFCKGQIAHYKIPRYVQFVKEYPMTVTGKVQKFALRDAMARTLGLEDVA